MHKIHYLPIALDDLKSIVRYITYNLESPRSAERLISKVKKEVQKIANNPFRYHLFVSREKLKHEYRVLHIDNYSFFYTVGRDKIEIHRVIHALRDISQILIKIDENN
jgi:addiction module RelE/StbE family toxin